MENKAKILAVIGISVLIIGVIVVVIYVRGEKREYTDEANIIENNYSVETGYIGEDDYIRKKSDSGEKEYNSENNTTSENENISDDVIKVRYAYNYDVPTADDLNKLGEENIDILEFNIKGEDLIKVKELLQEISFEKADLSMYDNTDYIVGIAGTYEVTINSKTQLLIDVGSKWAMYTNEEEETYLIEITEDFVNEIERIVQQKINNNVNE